MRKSIKIVLALLIIAVVCLGYTTAVNATPGEDLIAYLSKPFTIAGETVTIPSGYIKEVQRYIDTYGITADQVTAIEAKIEEGIAVMNNAGVSDVSKLSQADKDKLMGLAQEAAAIVDATVTFGKGTVTVIGKDGKTFGTFVTVSKNGDGSQTAFARTGEDTTLYLVSGIAIIAIASLAVVYTKKKANA